jgi:hypothetical protein
LEGFGGRAGLAFKEWMEHLEDRGTLDLRAGTGDK